MVTVLVGRTRSTWVPKIKIEETEIKRSNKPNTQQQKTIGHISNVRDRVEKLLKESYKY